MHTRDDEFQSIYETSRQTWKVVTAGTAFGIGTLLAIGSLFRIPLVADLGFSGTLASIGLVFGALAFGSLMIRCPSCKARWVWIAVSERDASDWWPWLLGLEFCPRCGFGSRDCGLRQGGACS